MSVDEDRRPQFDRQQMLGEEKISNRAQIMFSKIEGWNDWTVTYKQI